MTTNEPLHVLIAGGGIGGLALANGLHRAGVRVTVLERDRHRIDRLQGFRIHIDPRGSGALRELLAPELFSAFVAAAGKGGNGFGFVTEQMRELMRVQMAAQGHYGVSRITLRQILLAELGDIVRFDSMVVGFERRGDGTVAAHLADGDAVVGDVLVGADGGGSRVRAQYLPHAKRIETGIVAVAGKYALTDEARARLDPRLVASPLSVLPPSGCGMFVAPHEFDQPELPDGVGGNDGAAQRYPGLLFDNTQPYVFWAYASRRERYGVDLESLDPAGLHRLIGELTADWAPELRRLIGESDPETATLLPIRTSVPIEPWPATTVTLLGDAIHSMTPFRGIGANVALRDAQLLCRKLIAADRREQGLVAAIGDYEREMIDYGFAAVRSSLAAAEQAVSDSRFGREAGKLFFRTVNAVPAVKRRVFAEFGTS
ncbi:FAD-dependent oxidoreductase [Nocardia terpenica]|uniref:FAD-dependent monooxygenase n=1 Tax=Nocardia terpenica TaxID=455432 RepID=A0A6G9Z0V6_9NOCA|nr:NAD(P)/FAD-dependent oxidoreductase [Nocardia terpenica]QIS19011.1 FAD-dependent monooxygenase [Nocardia terpenica]